MPKIVVILAVLVGVWVVYFCRCPEGGERSKDGALPVVVEYVADRTENVRGEIAAADKKAVVKQFVRRGFAMTVVDILN